MLVGTDVIPQEQLQVIRGRCQFGIKGCFTHATYLTEMHTPTVGLQIAGRPSALHRTERFQRIDVFECENLVGFTLDGCDAGLSGMSSSITK